MSGRAARQVLCKRGDASSPDHAAGRVEDAARRLRPAASHIAPAAADWAEARTPTFESLPDIAAKFRRMAAGFGARQFTLFTVGRETSCLPPVPHMDAAYPQLSEESVALAGAFREPFVRRMTAQVGPCWWCGDGKRACLSHLHWVERVSPAVADCTGLALPLAGEGSAGFVVFCGTRLIATDQMVWDAHWRAFGLFSVVARLMPSGGEERPVVSRREIECLRLTADGLTSEQIAERLGLSIHTANQYLGNAVKKLDAVNRIQAVAKALRAGIID